MRLVITRNLPDVISVGVIDSEVTKKIAYPPNSMRVYKINFPAEHKMMRYAGKFYLLKFKV